MCERIRWLALRRCDMADDTTDERRGTPAGVPIGFSALAPIPPEIHVAGGGELPVALVQALLAYEHALGTNNVDAIADFLEPGSDTVRADAGGLTVGHDRISAIAGASAASGTSAVRVVTELRLIPAGADWLAVSVNAPVSGGKGVASQLWRETDDAWRIVAAHVTAPMPAVDTRVWRLSGAPLAEGAPTGPLTGRTVAVKDIFAIAGQRVGAGSRVYLAEARVEPRTAPAVQALLDAGADVAGIAQTDQFAYSIAGLNTDYGAAPNPAVRGGIPGGSSSGPASAVALGHVDIGIGSDTAGSIRIPASYQGLWGLRTTHGAVSLKGVLPLAPRYDTVGWLTRDGLMMLATASVGLGRSIKTAPTARVLVCEGVNRAATAATSKAVMDVVDSLVSAGLIEAPVAIDLPPVREMFESFRVTQSAEAWRADGAWVSAHPGALAPDVEARFEWARAVTADQEAEGLERVRRLAAQIDAALGDDVLVLPSAASAAPSIGADAETLNTLREATLGMTAIAGLTGRPALSVPLAVTDDGPVGVCLIGPRGSDLALIERAIEWEQR